MKFYSIGYHGNVKWGRDVLRVLSDLLKQKGREQAVDLSGRAVDLKSAVKMMVCGLRTLASGSLIPRDGGLSTQTTTTCIKGSTKADG